MAKGKSSQSAPKGQKAITSFFAAPKKSKSKLEETDGDAETVNEAETDAQDDVDVEIDADEDEDAEMDASHTTNKKGAKPAAPDALDLPPISDIPAIFDDLVSHIPEIKEVAERVEGRKLRVATMCSGTESPLLALELIQKSILEQHGTNFDIEHVFSCEIEPFKQAYIERNFHPPLLFRDVCELGDAEA